MRLVDSFRVNRPDDCCFVKTLRVSSLASLGGLNGT